MRISITNVGIGVAAGALDEGMEFLDEKQGRAEPFKCWTDWSRIALTALGYLGQGFNFFPRVSVPLAQSEVTLLTKSIGKVVRAQVGGGTATMVSRRRVAQPRAMARVHQTAGPGFEDLKTY
jgi:hypothetical protein